MHRNHLVVIVFILSAIACHNDQSTKEETTFFPVATFLQGQIHSVDSLKLPVSKYITFNNRTDSASISITAFNNLATEFVSPDISDSSLTKYYTETVFADQSIASVTMTYSTANKALPLQRLDVIIHADPVQNDQVKSIYMEKSYNVNDASLLKKLYWKADRNFQIITIRQTGDRPSETNVIKVVWNNSN